MLGFLNLFMQFCLNEFNEHKQRLAYYLLKGVDNLVM